MTELLTAAQMRAIEQAAIESGDVTGLELMERAGQGVVDAIFKEWPELLDADAEGGAAPRPADSPRSISAKKKRAVVLCGPGNNGGDGFVVARLLHERGWTVEVFLYGDAEKLPPDARVNYERWCELGVVERYVDTGTDVPWLDPKAYRENSLFIDALFGTGLVRPVERFNSAAWVTHLSEWRLPPEWRSGDVAGFRTVAIDLVSGLCADSGKFLRSDPPPRDLEQFRADLTVSFHSEKLGHHLAEGPEACGKVVVVDIGLSPSSLPGTRSRDALLAMASPEVEGNLGRMIVCKMDENSISPNLAKEADEHKYTHGHALILSGGAGKTGAARLAARGALRIGAGLVTLGVPPEAQAEVAAQVTAVMMKPVADAAQLDDVLGDARFNALCLGPGLGLSDEHKALVATGVKSGRAMVLDADALTLVSSDRDLFDALHENCVLTPHGGEFARLFPDIAEELNAKPTKGPAYSKVDATRAAAKRVGCTVLFKGPDTVIAAPDGRCSINSAQFARSAPWLATAGSGDVLAGFVTGLLARGLDPMQAAETAAWLHVEAALKFGPGLIAEDLPEQLPAVFRDLGM